MTKNVILNVSAEDNNWFEEIDFDAFKVAEELKDITFNYIALIGHELLDAEKAFVVNVCLSNDENVHRLNKEFRQVDRPTNVLSFANIDSDEFWDEFDSMDEVELGDIILAFETLQREAVVKHITTYAHYCHLLVHGFLHILGFDHQEDDEAEEMEGLETEILAQFSIDNPYRDIEGD